jgi:CSLREA domain-containing protein
VAVAAVPAMAAAALGGHTIPARAAQLEVTTTADTPLAAPNDCSGAPGHGCSLRAAIRFANGAAGPTTIHVPGTDETSYRIAIPPNACAGDTDSCGDYNITTTQPVTIQGDGIHSTVVDGNRLDRLFRLDAHGAHLTLGAMTVRNGHPSASDSFLGRGGAIDVEDGTVTMDHVLLTRNHATASGAGINVGGFGTIDLTDVTVSNNQAGPTTTSALFGGGISVNGQATLNRVTISDNTLDAGYTVGGGIYVAGNATLTNVTITGNQSNGGSAYSAAGGIGSDGNTSVTNGTVAGNSAKVGANIAVFGSPGSGGDESVFMKGGIVAYPAGGGANCDVGTGYPSQIGLFGWNLEYPGTSCAFDTPGKDIQGQDPLLKILAYRGGSEKTMSLTPGSPAIDAIDASACPPPATDERGVNRPQGPRCDMGAVENRVRF